MRNTSDGVCPECGWVLEVGVLASNAEQRQALWVMCGWPACFAASIVWGIAFSAFGWYGSWIPDLLLGQIVGVVFLALLAYGILGAAALILNRGRAFRRAHRWLRIGWALLFLLCVLLALSQPLRLG